MTEMKKRMCDTIIKKLGHEHPATVFFIKTVEEYPEAKEGAVWALLDATLKLVESAEEE
jgi:hypothetical protein